MLNLVVDRGSFHKLEYEMERANLPDDYNCSEIRYCGHLAFPYAHIQMEKSTKLILSHYQEEDYAFIYDTLNKRMTQLVCVYIFYRPKKNANRTDITNDDQKAYAFAPTYGDGLTTFHCHMISVVLFSYSHTLQSMLMDYTGA